MNKKTISIGGATYDLFVRVPHNVIASCRNTKSFTLPLGEKVRVQEVIETCGGGANNTAVGLARLGCNACFDGVIGNDQWGMKLIENFQREGVHTDCITIVEGEISSFSIILSASSGERIILYTPGTNKHLHDANFDRDNALSMDWIYLNHIQEQSRMIQDDIIEITNRRDSPKLTWNPGGYHIEKGVDDADNIALLRNTTFLQLNSEESRRFTRAKDIDTALNVLTELCPGFICITQGSDGTTASDGSNIYHCSIIKEDGLILRDDQHTPDKSSTIHETSIQIIDTTGAGDAFGTGVTWALANGISLPEALRAGTINAASVIRKIGAQEGLLTDTEIRKQLSKCDLTVDIHPL